MKTKPFHWTQVEGWLHPHEGKALQLHARGKRVLEIGSYKGRSTTCLAEVALSVHNVDPFLFPAGSPKARNIYSHFRKSVDACGNADRIVTHIGKFSQVSPYLASHMFDLVFVDGGHDKQNVDFDVMEARRLVAHEGIIAVHDYGKENFPDVTQAVDVYLSDKEIEKIGSLALARM